MKAAATSEKVVRCFSAFDRDGDGKISRSELRRLLQILDKSETLSESKISLALDAIDTSGDGYIDYIEFVGWLESGKANVKALLAAADQMTAEVAPDLALKGFGTIRLEPGKADEISVRTLNVAGTDKGGVGNGVAIGVSALPAKSYFVCTIDWSRDNDGEGMYIGVAACTSGSLSTDMPCGQCWVLFLATGQIFEGNGQLLDPSFTLKSDRVIADLNFSAQHSDITVLTDTEKCSLEFSVNGGDFVDSGLKLPVLNVDLRVYVHSYFLEDAITVHF